MTKEKCQPAPQPPDKYESSLSGVFMPRTNSQALLWDAIEPLKILSLIEDIDREGVVELIHAFRTHLTPSFQRLEEAVSRSDFNTIAHLAHALRSGVATLGLRDLAGRLRELEILASHADSEALTRSFVEAKRFAAQCLPVLESLEGAIISGQYFSSSFGHASHTIPSFET